MFKFVADTILFKTNLFIRDVPNASSQKKEIFNY